MPVDSARLETLTALSRKALWLSSWTIHHANHIRPNADGLKVGGHQASSASLATIMSALYFHVLKPEDRVAVKPHASPVFHAIQYLFGRQSREKLQNFRGFKGAQSYPSRTKDVDDVDFSTGSVGLGVAQALPEGPAAYPEDQLTDRDERFFAAEALREKLFETLGEELPYRCEVMIDSFKEEGRLRRIEATILVERESQKAIVLGTRGERLKAMASAARKDLERLYQGKVYLGVWIKVRRAWTDDARVLRQLGYE